MPRLNLASYFFLLLFGLFVYFLFINRDVAWIYLALVLFSGFTMQFFSSKFYRGVYFVIIFSIVCGYFIRPMVLVNHPELFFYKRIASSTDLQTVTRSLIAALLNTIFICCGFIAAVKLKIEKKQPVIGKGNFMLKNFVFINAIIIMLTLIHIFLGIYANVGIKGQEANKDTTFAFLIRFLSPGISFAVYFVYLNNYWKKLNLSRRLLVAGMILLISYSIFISGSKTFLALFGLCYFFSFIYKNAKFNLGYLITLNTLSVFLIAFSFIMAAAVKFSPTKSFDGIMQKAEVFADSHTFLTMGDAITQRLVGLDGQIVVYNVLEQSNKRVSEVMQRSFSLKQMGLQTLNALVPKVTFTTLPNGGKVASEYLEEFEADKSHAGAIGLFASVYLMCGQYSFI
ncbi:MAG TPA: hypothetical protein PL045_08300, partial [Chitinophagaceae bacterium]|nr:hypothetical protein [Chitinophagaceae bacterium]